MVDVLNVIQVFNHVQQLLHASCIIAFEGEIPGASARDCGNYLDMNLPMANYMAKRYLTEVLENITEKQLVYPE